MISNWDTDPELKALRDELIDSFPARKAELDTQTAGLVGALSAKDAAGAKNAVLAIHVVVHKLAGAAASYGFVKLGALAESLDDLLSEELGGDQPQELALLPERARGLSQALQSCWSRRGDL